MSAIAKLPRTQFKSLYAKRVPAVLAWAGGLGIILGWPHAAYYFSNKANHVPKNNKFLF